MRDGNFFFQILFDIMQIITLILWVQYMKLIIEVSFKSSPVWHLWNQILKAIIFATEFPAIFC